MKLNIVECKEYGKDEGKWKVVSLLVSSMGFKNAKTPNVDATLNGPFTAYLTAVFAFEVLGTPSPGRLCWCCY